MFATEISSEELRSLSLSYFEGKINVIERYGVAETIADKLRSYPVLGFDTESRPSFKKGKINRVALMQLATDKEAYLFRLCKMDIPKNLQALIADPKILKIGLALKNDLDLLKKLTKITPSGFIDLQDVVPEYNIKNLGLSKIAGIVMGVRISKSQQVSNWENNNLTPAQQRYAATDAWMCYMIYQKLKNLSGGVNIEKFL